MYSTDNLHDKFPSIHGNNADHFIAVKNVNGEWFYDTNTRYIEFTPTDADRLVAEVDFSNDTVSLLSGIADPDFQIEGMNAGYLDGDLVVNANEWIDPRYAAGEFGVHGTSINLAGNIVNEDTALIIDSTELILNDSDIDGDTLSITAVEATADTHGTVSIDANGDVVFTPLDNYAGEATFNYTVSDTNGGVSEASVTLNVISDGIVETVATAVATNEADSLSFGANDDIIDGKGGNDYIDAGAGDDTIAFDAGDTVDGGDGLDTLEFTETMSIDLSALDDSISNIETINLGEGTQNITSLSIEDVLNVTDVDNILRIDGDAADSVNVDTNEWGLGVFKTDAETNQDYTVYESTDDDGTVLATLEVNVAIDQS